MKSWHELLAHYTVVRKHDFGPFTGSIASAIVALQDAPWFEHVGEPLPSGSGAVSVASWELALTVFDDHPRYSMFGHLGAPKEAVIDALDRQPEREAWVEEAFKIACETVQATQVIPASLPMVRKVYLGDHLEQYQRWLIAEIAVQDVTSCTYFREQLAWWFAGHVPCGWEGVWPAGKHRVF